MYIYILTLWQLQKYIQYLIKYSFKNINSLKIQKNSLNFKLLFYDLFPNHRNITINLKITYQILDILAYTPQFVVCVCVCVLFDARHVRLQICIFEKPLCIKS